MSRILVGVNQLDLGGCQLNALDLATGMRNRGHEVEILAAHTGSLGPMADIVRDRGIGLTLAEHPLDRPGRFPFRRSIAEALTHRARQMKADLLHAYEYPLILDAFYGPSRSLDTPLVGTVYAMAIPTWLPRTTTFIAGTRKLVAEAREVGQLATLIEPPVNPKWDDPAIVDGAGFRRMYGIDEDEIVLAIVSRLVPDMKEEGVARAVEALLTLDDSYGPRLRLVVTGTGASYDALATRAASVNTTLGRDAVVMTGALADPRPVYAGSDIALGMGSSALRAMAYAKPLIVLGIEGFSRPFDEGTAEFFFDEGFYGIGSGDPDPLASQIAQLMDKKRRRRVGDWFRRVVLDRYGLETAVDTMETVYEEALGRSERWLPTALQTTVHWSLGELVGTSGRDRLRPIARRVLARQGLT